VTVLTLGLRYLTGRAIAASPTSREEAEWPPHPGRLFLALVAAWGVRGADVQGREALGWLERLPPPRMCVPDAELADVLTCFVPANDKLYKSAGDAKAIAGLPDSRVKAARQFPSAVPGDELVYFTWEATPAELATHRSALEALCRAVTYVGNSRSPALLRLFDAAPEPNWLPVEGRAEARLRVPAAGWLLQLEEEHARLSRGARRTPGPLVAAWQGYARRERRVTAPPPCGALAGDILVLRRATGPRLALPSTLLLTSKLRAAAMACSVQPVPEVLSGHGPDGRPSRTEHVAFVPLADVGHEHAVGALLGVAALVPTADFAEDAIRAVARVEKLTLGRAGVWELQGVDADDHRKALDPSTWTRAARRWATVTPVVLDRFPKREGDAEETIAVACERAGLPRPMDVVVGPVSLLAGVPTAHAFPPLEAAPGKPRRWHAHALVTFEELVRGPVLIGAGRYRGYGFCRPVQRFGEEA
jgi:CRISPR-associated protein Csb2